MRRAIGFALLAVLFTAFVAGRPVASADEDGAVRWYGSLDEAYRASRARRVPVFLATHFRGGSGVPAWPADAILWNDVYGAPEVASRLAGFACVQVVRTRAPFSETGAEAGSEGRLDPLHLVADAAGNTLAIRQRWEHAPGAASVGALVALLEEGRARFAQARPPVGPSSPRALERVGRGPAGARDGAGPRGSRGALDPIPLPRKARGVRIHLAFAGRVPLLPDGEEVIRARALASWDLGTTHPVGMLELRPGEEGVDRPVDVPLAELRGTEEEPALGLHRIDLWIEPAGSFVFATEPLYMGVVYVDVQEGDGGGGGGGGGDDEQPQEQPEPEPTDEEQPPPPEPPPPEGPEEREPEPPPPEEERVEVVDPLVRNDETVHKEDAVVAVPDPEAGLEPPPQVPLEEALREFERVVERAMGSEKIRGKDRDFLRRYFEALEARAREGGGR